MKTFDEYMAMPKTVTLTHGQLETIVGAIGDRYIKYRDARSEKILRDLRAQVPECFGGTYNED